MFDRPNPKRTVTLVEPNRTRTLCSITAMTVKCCKRRWILGVSNNLQQSNCNGNVYGVTKPKQKIGDVRSLGKVMWRSIISKLISYQNPHNTTRDREQTTYRTAVPYTMLACNVSYDINSHTIIHIQMQMHETETFYVHVIFATAASTCC